MINGLATLFLLLTLVTTLCYKFFGGITLLIAASAALSAFTALQWSRINITGRVLIGIAALSLLFVGLTPSPLDTLETAFSRAVYFATFLVALAFLRLAAKHSYIVKRCGKLVVNQPPGRRYGLISFASYLFGTVLNFGVLHLLGQMVEKGNTLNAAGGHAHIQQIRRERMSLAILRGFSVVPLASPFSITMTVMLATIPGLNWLSLLPVGAVTALLLMLLGWGFDFTSHPRRAPVDAQYTGPALSWFPALQFLGIVVVLFLSAALVEKFTPATLPLAIMLLSPVVGLLWLCGERLRAGPYLAIKTALTLLAQKLPEETNALRSEISIISGACFFGVVVSELLPHEAIVTLVHTVNLSGVALAFSACIAVTALAHFGISPIASVTIIAASLTPATAFGLSPELLALGLMSGWCLSMNSSPVSITSLLLGQITNTSPKLIAYRWNLSYWVSASIGLGVWLIFLNQLLPVIP